MAKQQFQPQPSHDNDDQFADDEGWSPAADSSSQSDPVDHEGGALADQEAHPDQAPSGSSPTAADREDLQEQERGSKERPPDRSGFSVADSVNEKLGMGYTGKGSEKSRVLSKLYSSNSGFKKKVAIAGAMAGGSMVAGIITFIILLPLKIDTVINNVDNKFGAASQNALETETDNLFSNWVRRAILPALNKSTCTRTIDPGCVPVTIGTGPIGRTYAAWKKDRLDQKLAQDYGIIIGRKSNGSFVMNVGGRDIDLGPLQRGERSLFDLPGTKGVTSAELRLHLKTALADETWYKKVYKRYFITKKLDATFGTNTHCLVTCKITDKVGTAKIKYSDAKLAGKLWIVNRILASDGRMNIVLTCMLTPEECSTSLEPRSDGTEGPERSKIQAKIDAQIENYLSTHTLNDFAKLAETATDLNKLGVAGYITRQFAQTLASALGGDAAKAAAGQAVEKAIPFVGWATLAASLYVFIYNAPKVIQYTAYASDAIESSQTYTTFKVAADEMHAGYTDSTAFGSLSDALSANSDIGISQSDMTSTPMYQEIMGGSVNTGIAATVASIFGVASAASPTANCQAKGSQCYKCNDGQPLAGVTRSGSNDSRVCPEEQFTNAGTAINAINDYENSHKAIFNKGASDSISKFLSISGMAQEVIGGPISSACSAIPLCKDGLNALTDLATSFPKWLYDQAVPNPFKDMSGGRTFDMVAAGADVTHNAACYELLGCAKISSQAAANIQSRQLAEAKAEFDSQSMFARMFSTSSPYSLISRLAVAMPSTPLGMSNAGLASLTANPLTTMSSAFFSLFSSNHAFAASAAQGDPFGVLQNGYADQQIPSPDAQQTYWDQNCAPYYDESTGTLDNSKWYDPGNGSQAQDQGSGQEYATKPNPCMLINRATVSAGGKYDTSMLPQSSTSTTTP